jgi:hypothetical protein
MVTCCGASAGHPLMVETNQLNSQATGVGATSVTSAVVSSAAPHRYLDP